MPGTGVSDRNEMLPSSLSKVKSSGAKRYPQPIPKDRGMDAMRWVGHPAQKWRR